MDIFRDYLSNRYQQVKIDNYISEEAKLIYGVPQGSILGPTLFLVYINSLCHLPLDEGKIFVYADDTVILISGSTWDDVLRSAENAMNKVSKWLSDNVLSLNVSKTKFLTFALSIHTLPSQDQCVLKIHRCNLYPRDSSCTCPALEYAKSVKYLGVLIDGTLT